MPGQHPALTILRDADVLAELRRAYYDSRVGGDNPIEQGGFILRDSTTGKFEVARLPAGGRDSLVYPLCPDGLYEGRQIVGTFHTHPNVGSEWQQDPSPQDIRLSQDHPETMGPHQFVISRETI